MLVPCNRHIVIKPIQEKEEETKVLLPDGYRPKSVFTGAVVLAMADNCSLPIKNGDTILINGAMVEEVAFQEKTYYLLLENHVIGKLSED
tara:strand:- start:782 stop:1051 length:270 start_codon:yes stop_codon:yes gene_type:complete